ncbi:MBOAT-domain-containing protein [Dendrothele bispora CBS 962.96]|uniref:O-acyltransferase n=1 Tax=Dendrothele bispora (strain CBS 962.96) TaxID=1314807 RepID=A0A4S8MJT8_DENBC|nr:MBOAT-domain-containing protein [Dendrothele bispora CBS 962.96]
MSTDTSSSLPIPPTRTESGGFKTSDGTLYVSKPFRSKTSKKLRALVAFAPRQSAFDINNEASTTNEFRGFFTLFWISIFIFMVRTYILSFEEHGHALNLHFASMFSRDAITLALSDGVLVASTGVSVLFAKAIAKGWVRYYWTGVIIQHIIQTVILFTAISWTFNRQWPWVQSGFLTLHSLVMIMKMHSYMSVNGYLQYVSEHSQRVLDVLREATDSVGGWDKALADAKAHRAELDAATAMTSEVQDSPKSITPSGTPPISAGAKVSYVDPSTANQLRKRLTQMSGSTDMSQKKTSEVVDAIDKSIDEKKSYDEGVINLSNPHPLTDHPNEEISRLATEYSELEGELSSTGPLYVVYPNNLTWKNFAVYQLIPTLVYELEYPRTEKIRPLYVFEKTVATFGTFALLYTVTESFILPMTPSPGHSQSFLRLLLDLALPFMIAYILLFYIIFECICNGFAELSCFADRQFYEDWWNSTSWDEFSRKWNKPVHTFLLRHVYASTIASYQVSRSMAMFLTFLLSACVHELVMVVVTKKFRFYLFVMQLIQIPLIAISRMPAIKRNRLMGNVVFWLGLYAGFPLLCVAYVAY